MKLLAITSCPTGIAHTYMAAESLQMAAKAMGIEIKVETRGSVGVENEITPQDIKEAHALIIAADTQVDREQFAGLPIINAPVQEAIKNPKGLIESAMNAKKPNSPDEKITASKEPEKNKRSGPYKHLMTGVSYMIPLVSAGGLIIALSFIFGIDAAKEKGTLAAALMDIGGGAAFALMVPLLAGFIAHSIADRPGLVPGLVGGMLAAQIGSGFLGGIIAGFCAGYIALWIRNYVKLPKSLEGLKPVLIIPFFSTLLVGLLMVYVIGTPVKAIMDLMTQTLKGMTSANAGFLGLILGGMMAFDMGGPINKAAYAFGVALLSSSVFEPMAAIMAAGMTPPLGLALATVLAKNKFTPEEQEAGKAASVMGISFITEGAIPFAAADPFRVIPALVAGSAITGALSMLFNCALRAPHGGIFVLLIPNAVSNLGMYVAAIAIGTILTALLIILLKKSPAK
ncbi:fructose-specific PTS transporter subunit EIIC [Pelosinus fermentans]|jgi:PTS system fructose-specific IIC component|uniref:PTS system, fructose subfamily, IIC subunit n=2 Tax=Pelosinus TaxID=365348 RepID=I8REC4_9FIRM|nr:fructose-specific PTS transporter subunit EIIC [Pelosinus fermentans]EIW15905.1 PTS system, fructose subfamily, IIC subunit [Pelosinus fermentans B4]EIW27389.1 PTS system, fructose subfamily, IIC subunit [Pelosinus fermentans A11]OAM92654.1 PTS system, fructose subfamily, IIC subunit [Pelosinus fermentans DSM 17108]SDQ52416.1 PTS system D-fructose-specific IIB component (F1P-forming), Frc family /PTS system D-fructose-specific IIC component (F1P-forming), Frc family [Pelosinus fermentans]